MSSRPSPRLTLGQGGGAGTGVQSAKLTSLWGIESCLAGRPQSPAVKSLHLQTVGAIGPQASQDGADGVGRHHHMAFVDLTVAVFLLTPLPTVCHLQVDRRPHRGRRHPAGIPGTCYLLPSKETLSLQPKDLQKSS